MSRSRSTRQADTSASNTMTRCKRRRLWSGSAWIVLLEGNVSIRRARPSPPAIRHAAQVPADRRRAAARQRVAGTLARTARSERADELILCGGALQGRTSTSD
jgi:hypothetical protein